MNIQTANIITEKLDAAETHIYGWMARHGVACMRLSLGVIFLWFGGLKLFPGFSPAEALAGQTITALTFGLVPPELSVPALGYIEALMGVALLSGKAMRLTLFALCIHMAGTALPFFLLPSVVLGDEAMTLSLEGQYIVKNLVILSGAFMLGASLHRVARRDSVTGEARRRAGRHGRQTMASPPAPGRPRREPAAAGREPRLRSFSES